MKISLVNECLEGIHLNQGSGRTDGCQLFEVRACIRTEAHQSKLHLKHPSKHENLNQCWPATCLRKVCNRLYNRPGDRLVLVQRRLTIDKPVFFKMSTVRHLIFNGLSPKVDKIIRNTQRTTANFDAIQPTLYKISHTQVFWKAMFFKCSPSAILFLMDSFQKLVRLKIVRFKIVLHLEFVPKANQIIKYQENSPRKFEWDPLTG